MKTKPTHVLYARCGAATKAAVDQYAEERGVSLTRAITELIDLGLAAQANKATGAPERTIIVIPFPYSTHNGFNA